MSKDKIQKLEKLSQKAELTRFMHGKLAERNELCRKLIQVTVALLGIIVSVLAAFQYRFSNCQHGIFGGGAGEKQGVFPVGEVLLSLLILLPFLATTLVILDATVWRFRDKEEEHRGAVGIWGDWIRRANELMGNATADDEFKNIQKKYRRCMKQTPNTSIKKFIAYKRKWKKYLAESKSLDERST
ncbi:MAG: hypothetical protein OXN81_12145 [Alphaproteobacteria bacterium]|nr:hypothetical protein [Alphaproteobacteria bacterium]